MDVSSPYLEMRDSPGRGRGVFAARAIPSRTQVTVSPVLVLPHAEYEQHGRHTVLGHYAFTWRDAQPPSMALALGLGSIFNHAAEPNTGWQCDLQGLAIRYIALRDIAAGEELFICYGGAGKLWFEDAGAAAEGGGAGSGAEEAEEEGVGSLLRCALGGVEPL
jgi:SET domain-containing protein